MADVSNFCRWAWPIEDDNLHTIGHPFNEPRASFGANHLHEGCDLRQVRGKSIIAVEDAVVNKVHFWGGGTLGDNAYGNHVILEHTRWDGSKYRTLYAHLLGFEASISPGVQVSRAQRIGALDSTGNSSGDHLHIQLIDFVYGFNGYVYPKVLDPTMMLVGAELIWTVAPPVKLVTNQQVINVLYNTVAFNLVPRITGDQLVRALAWDDDLYPQINRAKPFNITLTQAKPPGVTAVQWDATLLAVLGLYK